MAEGWVVRLNHCIGRIVLDHVFEDCWYHHLDRYGRRAAFRQLDDDQLARAVHLARGLLAATPLEVARANERSFAWRGLRLGLGQRLEDPASHPNVDDLDHVDRVGDVDRTEQGGAAGDRPQAEPATT